MNNILTGSKVSLVLAGGVGLGAYQGGVYAALHPTHAERLDWIAASSIGAVNAAVIAGSVTGERIARLRSLWIVDAPLWVGTDANGTAGPWRHAYNWMRVVQTRVLGAPGHFSPRYPAGALRPFTSLYDLSPLRERLRKLVDWDRLNSGEVRFTVATTDVASGETVYFDTAKGDRIGLDHLLASAGYLPEFSPVDIGGRLLGDGGLSVNAPMEPVLLDNVGTVGERVCFVADLFSRDGSRPKSLESALARKNDLLLANQTYKRLELLHRQILLEQRLAELAESASPEARRELEDMSVRRNTVRALVYLSYRAPPEEAGPEKPFDLSSATAKDRWNAGELDMLEALRQLDERELPQRGCSLLTIRREQPCGSRV